MNNLGAPPPRGRRPGRGGCQNSRPQFPFPLPVSSSAPIFVGGLVRWLVDRRMRRALREHHLDEAALVAESDKSPGVLLASGYIAGGAIAGIVIAIVQGVTTQLDFRITTWASGNNPFFAEPNADWLALIPFVVLAGFLYVTGRQMRLGAEERDLTVRPRRS